MATFCSNFFRKIKGKIDNLVLYEVKGQQRMRKHKDKPLPPGSCTQNLQRCRMRAAVALYRANRDTEIPYIWKLAVKEMVMSGYNLFIKTNIAAFDQNHRIIDYNMLHFSCGRLELPIHLEITGYGDGCVIVGWKNTFPMCSARVNDCLHAVWLKNNGGFSLQTVPTSCISRAEEKAILLVEGAGTEDLHLYLYFSNQDKSSFSPNKYFFLRSKK